MLARLACSAAGGVPGTVATVAESGGGGSPTWPATPTGGRAVSSFGHFLRSDGKSSAAGAGGNVPLSRSVTETSRWQAPLSACEASSQPPPTHSGSLQARRGGHWPAARPRRENHSPYRRANRPRVWRPSRRRFLSGPGTVCLWILITAGLPVEQRSDLRLEWVLPERLPRAPTPRA